MKLIIFGAKSIALGACLAVQKLYKDFEVTGFLVSSKAGNPDSLAGLPVYELKDFPDKKLCVLIAVPEDIQGEVIKLLEDNQFHNHICIDSGRESELMEKYYARLGMFQSINSL